MKKTFTQSMAWLHTWGGLVFGWLLFAVFLTGSLSVFDKEIGHWMRPELWDVGRPSGSSAELAVRYLTRTAPEIDIWYIHLPTKREPALSVSWDDRGEFITHYLDPATGERVAARESMGGHFFTHFHSFLNVWPAGAFVIAAVALVMLAAIVSGIVIHRRRLFRDIFTFRPWMSSQRVWLDAHNVIGVLLLPFHLVMTYTGLVVFCTIYMPAGVYALYGGDILAHSNELNPIFTRPASERRAPLGPIAPLIPRAERYLGADAVEFIQVDHPGDAQALVTAARRINDRVAYALDRVTFDGVTGKMLDVTTDHRGSYYAQATMSGLHFAQFGGYAVRWLYFVAGLAATAMIGTGLVLFSVKRRQASAARAGATTRWHGMIEKLNVAAVAGPALASIAYLWANRVLPVELSNRPLWETWAFLGVWLVTLLHAMARPAGRAWVEQLSLAAIACVALPVLDAATADGHVLEAIRRGDWMRAGVDLTAVAGGVAIGWMAWRLARRRRRLAVPETRRDAPTTGVPASAVTE
ncbi:MAG: PepSY-associated TM helix domain-containing protein [Vicinamibacteraceae bacterium]